MITAVDSCIALDFLMAGSEFGEVSRAALRRCSLEGKLIVCEVVWAEVSANFPNPEEAAASFARLNFEFSPMDAAAALHAGVHVIVTLNLRPLPNAARRDLGPRPRRIPLRAFRARSGCLDSRVRSRNRQRRRSR